MSLPIYRVLDKEIGGPVTSILGKSKRRMPRSPKRILIIKLWALGDSVNSLPLLKALKERFPQATIDVLARDNNRFVYEHTPLVDNVLRFEKLEAGKILLKNQSYDLVFDLEPFLNLSALLSKRLGKYSVGFAYQQRSKLYDHTIPFRRDQHIVTTYLSMGEPWKIQQHTSKLPSILVSKHAVEHVTRLLPKTKKRFVGVAVGVGPTSRQRAWPPEHFGQTITQLLKTYSDVHVVLTGTKGEKPLSERTLQKIPASLRRRVTDLTGRLNLEAFFAVCKKFSVFLSADTGPMHIAAAQGAKTLGLFGPNLPSIWSPYGPGNKALYHQTWCSPCVINDVHEAFECIHDEYQHCMKLIRVEEVVKTMQGFLGGKVGRKN